MEMFDVSIRKPWRWYWHDSGEHKGIGHQNDMHYLMLFECIWLWIYHIVSSTRIVAVWNTNLIHFDTGKSLVETFAFESRNIWLSLIPYHVIPSRMN